MLHKNKNYYLKTLKYKRKRVGQRLVTGFVIIGLRVCFSLEALMFLRYNTDNVCCAGSSCIVNATKSIFDLIYFEKGAIHVENLSVELLTLNNNRSIATLIENF